MVKRYIIRATTGIDGLVLEDAPPAPLGPRQVRLRVRATSLNYRDLMMLDGALPNLKPNVVALSDGAGDVVEAGAEVARIRVGDRVAAIFTPAWLAGPPNGDVPRPGSLGGNLDGMLAEEVVIDADAVVPFPAHLSYEEAATLPCAAVTAWNALFDAGNLRPGETVLLLGTGGVSVFGLQFAHAAGARCIVTSSSDAKLERARALGAAETINYRSDPDWAKTVRRLTGGAGVHHVLEIGGGDTLAHAITALRTAGHLALIGARGGSSGDFSRALVQGKLLRVTGIGVGSRAMFEAMNRLIATVQLRPVVDRVYDFADAAQAYRDFARAAHFGKLVIRIP